MQAAGLSHIGKIRSQNQDSIFICESTIGLLPNLFVVADGMGGHNGGDVASNLAVETLALYAKFHTPSDLLEILINGAEKANEVIFTNSKLNPDLYGMGTTLSACVIDGDNLVITHIGDSRIYCINKTEIKQITDDHSYVWKLLAAGKITKEQAKVHPRRNVLTKVLGTAGKCEPDSFIHPVGDTESVLICSDGLTNMLDDEIIAELTAKEGLPIDRVQNLVDEANNRGGFDNISVILVDLWR